MGWKTYCVGRVTMRLPDDRPLTWSADFDDAEVKRLAPMSEQQFWDGVDVVRKRHLALKHDDAPSRLAHFEKVGSNAAFVFSYDNDATFVAPVLERFVHFDREHSYELRFGRIATGNVAPTPALFKPYIDKYSPIFGRMHLLEPGQIPQRDGLCVDGAVVSGDTGRNARVALASEIAKGSRLVVAYLENNYKVALYNGFEDLSYDEERAKRFLGYEDPEGYRSFTVVRKRERTVAGLAGQEFITRTTLTDGHTYYRMMWRVKGALDGGVIKPAIAVHLNTPKTANEIATGKPYDTLPPEPELLKLWDYALTSLQWRAGALPDGQQIQAVN
jgi:hypothetical protein